LYFQVGKLSGPAEASENLTIADFSYVEKVRFPPGGSDKGSNHVTPPHKLAHTFKFKSYCPKIFKRLRDFFDTDASSYMLSVCGEFSPALVIGK
jgi:1-phosphatidylinositol-4-phosphate 5-kinase